MGRKILDFIDAELKNQVILLQLATEIELYPEISVITRYLNIKLVNDNRAWISRLIELNGPTLDLIEKSGRMWCRFYTNCCSLLLHSQKKVIGNYSKIKLCY